MNNKKIFAFLVTTIMLVGIASPFMFQPAAGASTIQISPTFTIRLLTPSTNPARQQWALIVQNNLQALGVQAQRVIVGWDIIYARALTPDPSVAGKIHSLGGFDTLFVGYAIAPDFNPYGLFHSSQFAPTGQNYYFWNDSYNDAICEQIIRDVNATHRAETAITWQEYFYNVLPEITIYNSKEVVAMDPHMNATPFEKYHYPLWPNVELWQFNNGRTNASMAQTGLLMSLSTWHSTSYYDLGYTAPIYGEGAGYGMMRRGYNYIVTPYMAYNNYTLSTDGRNWTYWIQPGIFFHDGDELDARDVVATQRAAMTPDYACPIYSYNSAVLGSNTSVYFAGEAGTPGAGLPYNKYEVHFDLPAIWAFFQEEFAASTIYPASVLLNGTYDFTSQDYIDTQAAATTLANFRTTSFGAATDTAYSYEKKDGSPATYTGPMAAGPYKYVSYDPINRIVHLQKYNNYFRKTALEAQNYLQLTDYYSQYILDRAAAIVALQGGQVQVLDSQYSTQQAISALNPAWSQWVSYDAYGLQEFGFNMNHPVFGTGLDTPVGLADETLANVSAAHVRKAIDWLIPKKDICVSLLNGFASPGLTTSCLPNMVGFDFALYNGPNFRNGSASNAQAQAMAEFELAGYTFITPTGPSFWESYGLLLTVVELAVIVVLAGFYFYRPRKM
jgi:ABC-type transport system substrate-binding protein